MDTQTKTLIVGIALLIVVSALLSYQRTIVERDFETFDSEAGPLE